VVVDDAGTERQTVALSGAGLTGQPDLLVVSFRQTGEPSPGRLGMPVPVELVVRNEADVLAGVFKVSVEYSSGSLSPGQAFTVPFIADESEDVDPGDGLYAFTTHDLEPGEEITFTGVVLIPNEEQGRTVTVTAIADSCSGEEFTEATCRVAEFNEDNNRSESIDIDVPNFVD